MYSSMFSLVAVLCIFLRHRLEWTGLHLILFLHNPFKPTPYRIPVYPFPSYTFQQRKVDNNFFSSCKKQEIMLNPGYCPLSNNSFIKQFFDELENNSKPNSFSRNPLRSVEAYIDLSYPCIACPPCHAKLICMYEYRYKSVLFLLFILFSC